MTLPEIGLLVAAYLVGAIPFGLVVAHVFAGVDVREVGSGNIGATNVARTSGKLLGVATLLLDTAKGAGPVLFATLILHAPLSVEAAAGFLAVLGHVFPLYLRFRGGKGVATSLGVFGIVAPVPTGVAIAGFLVTYALSRIVSVGSLVAALCLVVAVFVLDRRIEVILLAGGVTSLVLMRHRSNIERLLRRREPKL